MQASVTAAHVFPVPRSLHASYSSESEISSSSSDDNDDDGEEESPAKAQTVPEVFGKWEEHTR